MKKKLFFAAAFTLLYFSFTSVMAQTLILQVDMTFQAVGQVSSSTGDFDMATDFIDVAGSFNEWDGANSHFSQVSGTTYAVTISDLTVGDVIEFKCRINGDWDSSEFYGGGPNRKLTVRADTARVNLIYDNYAPGLVPVYISINMNKKIADAGFDAATEFVDVAGSFNNWGAYDELWQDGTTGIYKGMVLAEVGDMEWKTRINADWDNSEFSGGGSNRVYTVLDTVGGVENILDVLWYNDLELSVNEDAMDNVSVYPNPFANVVTFENLSGVERISISNIVGQKIKTINVTNSETINVNTSELKTGMYVVIFHSNSGVNKAMRIIKR